ncbi:MAG TPA: dihydrolipoamide acetyltransferase family protein [Caulobacteraceae bacterium]|jgi:2-oxoisovalerate dehydrogenase E2 component (dihydrolipoyl transacylase)
MARYVFRLPDIGEGVAEAEIAAWHAKVGDLIAEEQPLADVLTDKATVEMTSPVAGRVVATYGEVGEMLAVGSPLAEFETDVAAADAAAPAKAPQTPPPSAPKAEPAGPRTPDHPAILAAPATRAKAAAAGVALEEVDGTGPDGRITPADLDRHVRGHVEAVRPAPADGVEEIRIVGLRRQIAEHMQEAKRTIPHFGYVEELDLTELERLRQSLNGGPSPDRPHLTLLPFLMLAVVRAARAFPTVNARYDHEAGLLSRHDAVHIGVATHTPGGLMVPVVRHAEARDLWDCARELQRVAEAARTGAAKREELSGSTITLTSLGPLGGVSAMPIINMPEVAILAPNRLVERPVVQAGQVVVRKMMNLSSAFDHRIVDGHDAAAFVQAIKRDLETPGRLFVPPHGAG